MQFLSPRISPQSLRYGFYRHCSSMAIVSNKITFYYHCCMSVNRPNYLPNCHVWLVIVWLPFPVAIFIFQLYPLVIFIICVLAAIKAFRAATVGVLSKATIVRKKQVFCAAHNYYNCFMGLPLKWRTSLLHVLSKWSEFMYLLTL